MNLNGSIAMVTGAAQGLGKAIATALAGEGAVALINDIPGNQKIEETAAEIRAAGGRARVLPADVGDERQVAALFDTIRNEFGRLDILVNNAGTTAAQDIFSTTLEDWDRVLRCNLTSAFLCSREAVKLMPGPGRIVNISSVTGERGALYGHVHYAATKSGLLGFTKTLARTLAPRGITVNAVAPGIIETELLQRTHGAEEVAKLAAQVPLGLGTPRDVALAVAFLCGPGGRYMTGATLDVNGGMHMH